MEAIRRKHDSKAQHITPSAIDASIFFRRMKPMSIENIRSLPHDQKEHLYNELTRIYQHLDSELSKIPQPCTGCGECCHFEKAEHRLYGSSLELAMLLDRAGDRSKTEDRCPYQIEGKCTVRQERLIGCRTYYRLHTKEDQVKAETLYEKALDRLKALMKVEGLTWEYRDLMSCFPKSENSSSEV
jgi:Fe-S-cluster containining protein